MAKIRTEYISAKEIIEMKLMEVETDCINREVDDKIKEIAINIKQDIHITIEKYYNQNIGLKRDDIIENLIDLKGIVVSVNEYSRYKFLIGKSLEIEGILLKEIDDSISIEDFKTIEQFEKEMLEKNNEDTIPPEYIGKKLETGDYVQYTANNYSKWVTVGTDEDGVTKIVSVGATDYYEFSGTNYEEAYKRLDNFCNERYVDNNLANSAESYSYARNIQPFNTDNKLVLWGLRSETLDELINYNNYAWFFDNHNSDSVFQLETGNWSYGGLGCSYLVRPVVTLKKNIIIIGGEGTNESPYIIKAK